MAKIRVKINNCLKSKVITKIRIKEFKQRINLFLTQKVNSLLKLN